MDPVAVQAPVAIQAMMTAVGQALHHAGPECWAALPEISARVVSALCSAVWEGALLAGVVALGLRLMPRLTAAARSVVWLNVFALVAGLHVVPLMMGRAWAGGGMWAAILPDSMRPGSIHSDLGHGALLHLDPRWSLAVAAVWAALTAWRLAELAASAVSLRGVARRATVVDAGETMRALLNGESETGRRGREAELCTSDEVERPCVIGFFGTGFFRPRVLIPEALLGALSEVELGQVLLHEMEHVRRRDEWRNLAQKIGVAVFPLNPALAWVEHRLCTERELACDDRVMRASAERKTYALCLARVAEFSIVNRGLALALGAWSRRPELVKRVQRILRRPAETHTGRMAVVGPAAMTLAALGCALALARSPQVVSFAPRPHAVTAARVEQGTNGQNADAARMIEASARMERGELAKAHATKAVMVKAVTSQKRAKATPALARVEQAAPDAEIVKTRAEMRRTLRTPQFVVMTEWERIEVPQVVITVQQENKPTYAAVPFGNGWLIVQI